MTTKEILEEWLSQTDQTNLKEGHYFVIQEAMKEYARLKCQELLLLVAEKVKIKTEKKSQYGKYRKWQKVKDEEEFDLFDYEMRTSVDKTSILNVVDLDSFIEGTLSS